MTKFITKTADQATKERRQRVLESTCPECGRGGAVGSISTRNTGFFGLKIERMNRFTCIICGCQWNTGWKVEK